MRKVRFFAQLLVKSNSYVKALENASRITKYYTREIVTRSGRTNAERGKQILL